jgi:hypothetical protein
VRRGAPLAAKHPFTQRICSLRRTCSYRDARALELCAAASAVDRLGTTLDPQRANYY